MVLEDFPRSHQRLGRGGRFRGRKVVSLATAKMNWESFFPAALSFHSTVWVHRAHVWNGEICRRCLVMQTSRQGNESKWDNECPRWLSVPAWPVNHCTGSALARPLQPVAERRSELIPRVGVEKVEPVVRRPNSRPHGKCNETSARYAKCVWVCKRERQRWGEMVFSLFTLLGRICMFIRLIRFFCNKQQSYHRVHCFASHPTVFLFVCFFFDNGYELTTILVVEGWLWVVLNVIHVGVSSGRE